MIIFYFRCIFKNKGEISMRTVQQITVSVDGVTLSHINLLRAKVDVMLSRIVQYSLQLFLREIGYCSEDLSDSRKVLGMLTRIKMLIDAVEYSEDEILSMIKAKKFYRKPSISEKNIQKEREVLDICMDQLTTTQEES